MYSLKISKKAIKFLQSRGASERKIIKKKLNLLKENPNSHELLDVKKLKNKGDYYRLRIGKMRIVYQILNKKLIIFVISAGNRGDIYKNL